MNEDRHVFVKLCTTCQLHGRFVMYDGEKFVIRGQEFATQSGMLSELLSLVRSGLLESLALAGISSAFVLPATASKADSRILVVVEEFNQILAHPLYEEGRGDSKQRENRIHRDLEVMR